MNLNLMPCCVKDCDRGAKTQVAFNNRLSYMCYTHALEVAKEADRRGIVINEDDDE